jgi:hypothetical protein
MKTSEPNERVIEYCETVYLCTNGEHDSRSVYLWRGNWYCCEYLKRAVRVAGGTSLDVYGCASGYARSEFRTTAHRRSEEITRVTPRNSRLLQKPKRVTEQKVFCEDCESTHVVGECQL